jgi:FHS family L-fucose permease-like MFS transporter
MPVVQGATLDATSAAVSFIVPAVCFAVVAAFAFYDLRAEEEPAIATTKAGAA